MGKFVYKVTIEGFSEAFQFNVIADDIMEAMEQASSILRQRRKESGLDSVIPSEIIICRAGLFFDPETYVYERHHNV